MCCSVLPPEIVVHDAYIGGRFRKTKNTRKASNAAENLQLYRVVWFFIQGLMRQRVWRRKVRFFHPRSSCMTMHISADVQRMTLNASCVVHDDLGWKNQTTLYILPCHWLYEWFSQFHSCGTYSVLSRSPSISYFRAFGTFAFYTCPKLLPCQSGQ